MQMAKESLPEGAKCGPKGNIKSYLQQTITNERSTESGRTKGWMTPSQIASLLDLSAAQLPANVLEQTLRHEIEANHKLHSVPKEQGIREGSCFWLNRYWYNHEKALDESHVSKSKEELGRSTEVKPGDAKCLQDLLPASAELPEEKECAKTCEIHHV